MNETGQSRRQQMAEAVRVSRGSDIEAIIKLLDAPEPAARSHAPNMIRRRGISTAIPSLVAHATDSDSEVRTAITHALADFRDPSCREALVTLLDDEEQIVRRLALRGVSRLRDESAFPAALSLYSERGVEAKQEALDALADLPGESSLNALQQLLASERSWVWRRRIRRALRGRNSS
jgi:HEAT repeat protein